MRISRQVRRNRTPGRTGGAVGYQTTAGVFVDLDADGSDEFILLSEGAGFLYQSRAGSWQYVGRLYPDGMTPGWRALMKALSDGDVTTVSPLRGGAGIAGGKA